jgi:hypothetical protein
MGDRSSDASALLGMDGWAWHGLTDIHEEAQSAGKDVHHGDHGTEQAP